MQPYGNPNVPIPVFQVNRAWYEFPVPPCDPNDDAKRLHKAIAGLGTDEKMLIRILGNRSKTQLLQISDAYGKHHKNSLEHDLKGDCSGNFLTLMLELIRPTIKNKIDTLKGAMDGVGTREKSLIDVLCQSFPDEINAMKRDWPGKNTLEQTVSSETSGDFKKLLGRLLEGKRMLYSSMNPNEAEAVARELYNAGEARFGTNDSFFIRIFTTYPPEFLQLVDAHYDRLYAHTLKHAVEKETSGDYQTALIALMTAPWDYFAHRIYHAMHGTGTDDKALIYCFSVLSEGQLKYISTIFKQRFGRDLKEMIRGDCSGHYKDLLLELC